MLNLPKTGLIANLLALPALVALAVITWPPPAGVAVLMGILITLVATASALQLRTLRRHRRRALTSSGEGTGDDGEAAAAETEHVLKQRMRALDEQQRRLELRELRLARRMRVHQLADDDSHIDLLDPHPADAELADLADLDRQLIALIEAESQLAFERVLDNRYASEDGVDTALIYADVAAFVEKVAKLYRPDSQHPLLETDIELVAKSASSTALHLLVVIDDLPIDLKSYNIATLYRLIRRAASYYGTYKAVLPYLDYGLSALHVARLALGTNPVAVGVTWLAGKLGSHGARAVTERVLQQHALQLLHDFVRVIGFEAAMVYGGKFRHRDANWVLGAELVNLEVSRGGDQDGRDAALADLCRLALRHEFDRVRLLRHLGTRKPVDLKAVRPQVVLTREEREAIAAHLAQHCRTTGVDLDAPAVARWRRAAEMQLGLPLGVAPGRAPESPFEQLREAIDSVGNPLDRLQHLLRRVARDRGGRNRGAGPEAGKPHASQDDAGQRPDEPTGGQVGRDVRTPPEGDAARDGDAARKDEDLHGSAGSTTADAPARRR